MAKTISHPQVIADAVLRHAQGKKGVGTATYILLQGELPGGNGLRGPLSRDSQ